MPCIQTKVNVSISPETEKSLKEKLGQAITLIPGKSENWLMLAFEDNVHLYFQGNGTEPAAFVEVKIYGRANSTAYDKMTTAITDLLHQELSISPSRIYVKYEETDHWGWNGNNF